MKWIWTLVATAAVSLVALYFWTSVLAPTQSAKGRDVTIAQPQLIYGDLITAGREVRLQTEIDGDLAAW